MTETLINPDSPFARAAQALRGRPSTVDDPRADVPSPGSGGGGGGGAVPPPAEAPPDPITQALEQFQDTLAEVNPQFRAVADELRGISQGEDPRFEAFRQTLLGQASTENAQFFGRRGTAGSTAALNQLQRTTGRLTSQLGMQQLARQDQARLQSLDVLRGFLENETIPAQLLLQQRAAETAATAADMAGQRDDPFLQLGPISVG